MAAIGPPDGGYGWVILAVSSFCMALIVSMARIGGIVFYIVIEKFNVTRTKASVIFVMARMCAFCAAPITGKLLQKLTYRKVFCIGGLMMSSGLILTSQANAFWQIVLTYGILLGSGMGLLLAASILIVGMYFKKRRSFAIGIYYTCGGVGSLVMPIIFGQLLEKYYFNGSILILGAVMLHPCALCMLIRQPNWLPRKNSKSVCAAEKQDLVPTTVKYIATNDENGQTNGNSKERAQNNGEPNENCVMLALNGDAQKVQVDEPSTVCQKLKSSFVGMAKDFAIFKDLTYVLLLLSRIGCSLAILSIVSFLPDYMKHEFPVPLNDQEVANVLAMSAIGDTISRFVVGSVLDKLPWPNKYTLSMFSVIIGVILFCLQEATTVDTLLACVIVYGLFVGSCIVVSMVLEAELMGPKKLPIAHGVTQLIVGLLSMVFGILIGVIRDSQGSYKIAIYLVSACSVVSGLVWFMEPLLIRCTTGAAKEDTVTEDQSIVLNANVESAA